MSSLCKCFPLCSYMYMYVIALVPMDSSNYLLLGIIMCRDHYDSFYNIMLYFPISSNKAGWGFHCYSNILIKLLSVATCILLYEMMIWRPLQNQKLYYTIQIQVKGSWAWRFRENFHIIQLLYKINLTGLTSRLSYPPLPPFPVTDAS